MVNAQETFAFDNAYNLCLRGFYAQKDKRLESSKEHKEMWGDMESFTCFLAFDFFFLLLVVFILNWNIKLWNETWNSIFNLSFCRSFLKHFVQERKTFLLLFFCHFALNFYKHFLLLYFYDRIFSSNFFFSAAWRFLSLSLYPISLK